jgi:outer membrane protein assembly factor BamB
MIGCMSWRMKRVAAGSSGIANSRPLVAPPPTRPRVWPPRLPSPIHKASSLTGDIAAINLQGDVLWYRSLVSDYPTITNQVGMAASPILFENKLIVPMDNAGESFIAALDIKTGENIWKTARPREINWTTPLLRKNGDKFEILFQGPRDLVSFDATTGAKLWTAKVPSSIPTGTLVGNILISGGGGTSAFQLEGANTKELWKAPRLSTGMSSPLIYDGRIYAAASSGMLVCADAKTGKTIWDIRLKGPFSGSPVAGDGKLYLINEAGMLYTIKAGGDTAEVITQSETKDKGQATPAISGGAIFLRGEKSLICIGDKIGG